MDAANTEYTQYTTTSWAAVATHARLVAEVARDDGRRGGPVYYRCYGIADGYNRGFARIVCYAWNVSYYAHINLPHKITLYAVLIYRYVEFYGYCVANREVGEREACLRIVGRIWRAVDFHATRSKRSSDRNRVGKDKVGL